MIRGSGNVDNQIRSLFNKFFNGVDRVEMSVPVIFIVPNVFTDS